MPTPRPRKLFPLAFVIFAFTTTILFPYLLPFTNNPDTLQYLSIAEKYSRGEFTSAINAYWSPLICWLLAIPLLIFSKGILVFKILQLLIGAFVLFQWCRLLAQTPLSRKLQMTLSVLAVPFLVDYALLNLTPDLLFIGITLLIINLVLAQEFLSKRNSIFLGISGAILYLTKAFGFPFFIVFMFVVVFYSKINSRFGVWRNTTHFVSRVINLALCFVGISLLWVVPLCLSIGEVTISKFPEFNLSRDAAPLPTRGEFLPILGNGLNRPQPNSISAWEHPGFYVEEEMVRPFTGDHLKIVKRNFLSIYYFDFKRQTGGFFLLLLLLFFFVKGWRTIFREKWIFVLLTTIITLYLGYSFILVHARYIWINSMLMALLSLYFIQNIFEKQSLKILRIILYSIVLLVAVKRPVKEIFFTKDADVPAASIVDAAMHPFQTLWKSYRVDHRFEKMIENLSGKNLIVGKNIASLGKPGMERDGYTNGLRVARASNTIYFGQVDDKLNVEEQQYQMKLLNVDYLVTWENTEWKGGELVYFSLENEARIYSLK